MCDGCSCLGITHQRGGHCAACGSPRYRCSLKLIRELCHVLAEIPDDIEAVFVYLLLFDLLLYALFRAARHQLFPDLLHDPVHPRLQLRVLLHICHHLRLQVLLPLPLLVLTLPELLLVLDDVLVETLDHIDLLHTMLDCRFYLSEEVEWFRYGVHVHVRVQGLFINGSYLEADVVKHFLEVDFAIIMRSRCMTYRFLVFGHRT